MSTERSSRSAALAPLVHWLLVIGGLLAAHRVLEHERSGAGALWMGAAVGTALGQGLAWRRVSLRALVLLGPLLLLATIQVGGVLCLAAGLTLHSSDPWNEMELGAMALVPAVACGYASMSERGGLLAFWFPTSLWALASLDGADGTALGGVWSWALLSVLAALFVGFLAAREARRVALWRRHGTVRLATASSMAVLRRSPTRSVAQAVWAAAMAGTTLTLTAWIAPHLWQNEQTPHGGTSTTQAAGAGGGAPCCPTAPDAEGEGHRLREYFPLLHPHGDAAPAAAPCVACIGGAAPVELSSLATVDGGAGTTAPAAGAPTSQGDGSQGLASGSQSPAAQSSLWTPPGATPPAPTVVAHAAAPPGSPWSGAPLGTRGVPVHPTPRGTPIATHPLPWIFALVLAGLLVQLALRPLRRLVTVRHLREALWSETVDQRVSNLWQLALVGLRDAGWHAAPGEQPLALARRADLPGAEACAVVLERTRHGVRLEARDLEMMSDAAQTAYSAARRRAGRLARALAWLRWPLV